MRTRGITLALVLVLTVISPAQSAHERSFPVSPSTLQSLLKKLPGGTAGPLPVLDGFVVPGSRSLGQYRRPYYQCTVRISPDTSGGSVASVTAKITAWNSDPVYSKYEVLESNGRIESDLLDRLQEFVAAKSTKNTQAAQATKTPDTANIKAEPPPDISAPVRQLPSVHELASRSARNADIKDPGLERQAQGLEDILRNQSHPTNLVAVRQEETPVLQNPSTDSTVLFLANAEDEFEILSVKPDWVYVRISGLSRGWIRRSSVEILDEPERTTSEKIAHSDIPPYSGLFTVRSEEVGNFPGQWAPLRGKIVRIISVQPTGETGHSSSSEDKLQFAETEFKQFLSAASSTQGVVLIFDSEDGGMIAATQTSLEQWKNGTLSKQAFWAQCYFDPPEILGSADP